MYQSFEDNVFYDAYGRRVWEIRHSFVSTTLQDHPEIKKVIDFGCAEGKLIQRLSRSTQYSLLAGIDIDEEPLEKAKQNVFPEPLQRSIAKDRKEPLKVILYHGSALLKNEKLLAEGYQAASIIEFIEHLYEKDLTALEENVFGYLKIPLVIVTTPNSEFNVYFNFDKDQKFRHWDHKFEWTREEFQYWANDICRKYSYTVTFDGIGPHKNGDISKGHCSQCAVFSLVAKLADVDQIEQKIQDYQLQENNSIQTLSNEDELKVYCEYDYPFEIYDPIKELESFILMSYNDYKTYPHKILNNDELDLYYDVIEYGLPIEVLKNLRRLKYSQIFNQENFDLINFIEKNIVDAQLLTMNGFKLLFFPEPEWKQSQEEEEEQEYQGQQNQ